MRSAAHTSRVLVAACVLLVAACEAPPQAQAPPPAPAAPAPPRRPPNLCERPAKPAPVLYDPKVEASFRAFGRSWLEKMRNATPKNGTGRRKLIRDDFETELRPTNSKQAPWVGVLRYCEQLLRCTGPSAASCQPSKSSVVVEIFRFQAGKWVY